MSVKAAKTTSAAATAREDLSVLAGCIQDRFFRYRHASGGIAIRIDCSNPCAGTGSLATPPPLPALLPPYNAASLFTSSAYHPGSGTPMRYSVRDTGVKLKIAM